MVFAKQVLDTADRHEKNGRLTRNEIETFLAGSGYEEFSVWLSARFKTFDQNHSSAVGLEELKAAVRQYQDEMEEGAEAGGELLSRAIRKVRKIATRMRNQCVNDATLNGSWFKVREARAEPS